MSAANTKALAIGNDNSTDAQIMLISTSEHILTPLVASKTWDAFDLTKIPDLVDGTEFRIRAILPATGVIMDNPTVLTYDSTSDKITSLFNVGETELTYQGTP